MIIRVEIYLSEAVHYYQNKDTSHVSTDNKWLNKLISISSLNRQINEGEGFRTSNVEIKIDDTKNVLRDIFSDLDRSLILGRKVIIYYYLEEDSGGWTLTQKLKWTGYIQDYDLDGLYQIKFIISDINSNMKAIYPQNKLTSAEYPIIMDENIGKYKQRFFGNIHAENGSLKAPNVANNLYHFDNKDITDDTGVIKNVHWRTINIDPILWSMQIIDGETYVKYIPPAIDDELPAGDVEFISVNAETAKNNPVDVLKTITDELFGTDVYFEGNAALNTWFDTNSIEFAGAFTEGNELGDIINEFAINFNIFSYVDDDNKLQIGKVEDSSQKTFTDDIILNLTATPFSLNIKNDIDIKFRYNFTESKFVEQENYKHTKSIDKQKTYKDTWEYFFIEDKDSMLAMVKEKVQRTKYPTNEINMLIEWSELGALKLGDLITVKSISLVGTGEHKYYIKAISYLLENEQVILTCKKYNAETDYIVNVMVNEKWADVTHLGVNVVQSGSELIIDITPEDANITVGWYYLDWVKQASSTHIVLSNIIANHDVLIVFQKTKYLVEAMTDGNGTISNKGNNWVTVGADSPSFTYTPNAGKAFSHWSIDGVRSTTYPYQFINVQKEHTICGYSTDTYAEKYTITFIFDGTKGRITNVRGISRTSKVTHYLSGKRIIMVFHPDDTYSVTHVEKDSVDITGNCLPPLPAGYSFIVSADAEFEVTFA